MVDLESSDSPPKVNRSNLEDSGSTARRERAPRKENREYGGDRQRVGERERERESKEVEEKTEE